MMTYEQRPVDGRHMLGFLMRPFGVSDASPVYTAAHRRAEIGRRVAEDSVRDRPARTVDRTTRGRSGEEEEIEGVETVSRRRGSQIGLRSGVHNLRAKARTDDNPTPPMNACRTCTAKSCLTKDKLKTFSRQVRAWYRSDSDKRDWEADKTTGARGVRVIARQTFKVLHHTLHCTSRGVNLDPRTCGVIATYSSTESPRLRISMTRAVTDGVPSSRRRAIGRVRGPSNK